MNKTKLWIFNIVMLVIFIVVVFVPIKDGKTLFEIGMDTIMGVSHIKNDHSVIE